MALFCLDPFQYLLLFVYLRLLLSLIRLVLIQVTFGIPQLLFQAAFIIQEPA